MNNTPLKVSVVDRPVNGQPNYHYDITNFYTGTNPSRFDAEGYSSSFSRQTIIFQNNFGAKPLHGEEHNNGVSPASLLEVIQLHMGSLSACMGLSDNQRIAFEHVSAALDVLNGEVPTNV